MPHSPRWHDGRLWVLESGTGQLVLVEPASGHRETVAELPGFARGLALHGQYAFIGLSKIRPTSAMDGVPLAERRGELKCGVAVVDLVAERLCATLEFQTAVEEIFADVGDNTKSAATKVLAYLDQGQDPKQLLDAARVLIFLKGSNSHDYKFSSAALEDFYNVSPQWRNRFLASSVFNLRGSQARDNRLVERTRAALA